MLPALRHSFRAACCKLPLCSSRSRCLAYRHSPRTRRTPPPAHGPSPPLFSAAGSPPTAHFFPSPSHSPFSEKPRKKLLRIPLQTIPAEDLPVHLIKPLPRPDLPSAQPALRHGPIPIKSLPHLLTPPIPPRSPALVAPAVALSRLTPPFFARSPPLPAKFSPSIAAIPLQITGKPPPSPSCSPPPCVVS